MEGEGKVDELYTAHMICTQGPGEFVGCMEALGYGCWEERGVTTCEPSSALAARTAQFNHDVMVVGTLLLIGVAGLVSLRYLRRSMMRE